MWEFRQSWVLWSSVALGCLGGCGGEGEPAPPVEGGLPPFDPLICARPEAPTIQIEAHTTGPVNNTIEIAAGAAWVVHSGDNTVGRFDLSTGGFDPAFVDVDDGRNPWALAEAGGRLFITNFLTDSLSVADAATGAVLDERTDLGLEAPTGVAAGGGVAVVVSSNFIGPGYGPGSIQALRLLDGPPFVEPLGRIESSARAPLDVVYEPQRRRFYVVESGDSGVDEETGAFVPRSSGAVEVIEVSALEEGLVAQDVARVSLPLSEDDPFAGTPRTLILAPDGRHGYLPSGSSPQLYKIDLETLEVLRGASNPIEVYLGEGNQLTGLAFRPDGVGYLTAFNQDALYLFDSGCDASVLGPFGLGSSALLEGPLDIAYDPVSAQALVIMSVSNALTIVRGP